MPALTVQQLESLVASIKRRLLSPPAPGQPDPAPELSKQFAEAVFEINRRLKQCLDVIGGGNAEQALTLAEENPPLLDAVALVNIGLLDQWEKLCQDNHWPVPVQLDTVAIGRLNDLYGKSGKSEESVALKKQLRVAMLTKNHERALAISRRLEQLEPGDAGMQSQGRELEKLVGRSLLSELRAALGNDEEEQVIGILGRIDATGLSLEEPEVERANVLREDRERRQDEEFAISLVGRLPALQNEDRWQECSELLDEIQSLQAKHNLDFGEEERDAVQASITFVDASRREAARQRARADAMATLDAEVGAVQTLLSKPGVAAAKLEDAETLLRRAFEAARAFDEVLPDELSRRASATLSDISDRVTRVHRLRRLRALAFTGFALVAVAALSVFSYRALRATLLAGEIKRLVAERSATALRPMIEDLRNRQSALLFFPNLKTATISAEEWLQSLKVGEATAVSLSEKLKEWDSHAFDGTTPREVFGTLKQFDEALASLPSDLSMKIGAASSDAVARAKLWLADRQEEVSRLIQRKLGDLRPLAERLSEGQSTDKIEDAVKQIRPHLEEVLPRIDAAGPEEQIPEAMRTEITEIAAKWRNLQRLIDDLGKAREKLNGASSLEEYWSAIDQLAGVGLPADDEVKAAQATLANKFTVHDALGSALIPQDPAMWSSIKSEADLSKPLHPTAPTLEQAQILSRLINNPNLENISELIIRKQDPYATPDEARPRVVYLRGKSGGQTTTGNPDWPTYTTGEFYDPKLNPNSATFGLGQYTTFVSENKRGWVVDSKKMSEASILYAQLGIADLTDEKYLQYNEGILPVMDRAISATSAPPLATAFVLKSLWEVASSDPIGWGIPWTPALKSDMQNLQQACPAPLDGSEWMVPAKQEDSARVEAWLQNRPSISYAKQANLHRRLAMDALRAGLVYCGFVDRDGKKWHPQGKIPDSVKILWGLEAGTGKVKPLMIREASAKSGMAGLPFKPAVLTPLLGSPLNQSDSIEQAFTAAGIGPQAKSQYLAELPPLFRSNPLP